MSPYHHAWACFQCRKSWKKAIWPSYRASARPIVLCPHCKSQMQYMGRHFAPPKRSDLKAWQELREWTRRRNLPAIATMTWQEILQNETVSSQKKSQSKKARRLAHAAWLKEKKRRRYLKDFDKWMQAQTP